MVVLVSHDNSKIMMNGEKGGTLALIRLSSFTELAKIKYEPNERCAHEQKKLSKDQNTFSFNKFQRNQYDLFRKTPLSNITFLRNTVLEFSTKSNRRCKMTICVRGFPIPILNYLNYLRSLSHANCRFRIRGWGRVLGTYMHNHIYLIFTCNFHRQFSHAISHAIFTCKFYKHISTCKFSH